MGTFYIVPCWQVAHACGPARLCFAILYDLRQRTKFAVVWGGLILLFVLPGRREEVSVACRVAHSSCFFVPVIVSSPWPIEKARFVSLTFFEDTYHIPSVLA